jgi:hypothetical protein
MTANHRGRHRAKIVMLSRERAVKEDIFPLSNLRRVDKITLHENTGKLQHSPSLYNANTHELFQNIPVCSCIASIDRLVCKKYTGQAHRKTPVLC